MVFRRRDMRDPFSMFDMIMRSFFDDMLDERGIRLGMERDSSYAEPAVDIVESGKEYHVMVDLPGVKKENIQLIPQEGGIELKAERKEEMTRGDEKKGFFHMERRYTGFYRFIRLPEDADIERADAEYRNGVLEIRVPKRKMKDEKKRGIRIR